MHRQRFKSALSYEDYYKLGIGNKTPVIKTCTISKDMPPLEIPGRVSLKDGMMNVVSQKERKKSVVDPLEVLKAIEKEEQREQEQEANVVGMINELPEFALLETADDENERAECAEKPKGTLMVEMECELPKISELTPLEEQSPYLREVQQPLVVYSREPEHMCEAPTKLLGNKKRSMSETMSNNGGMSIYSFLKSRKLNSNLLSTTPSSYPTVATSPPPSIAACSHHLHIRMTSLHHYHIITMSIMSSK